MYGLPGILVLCGLVFLGLNFFGFLGLLASSVLFNFGIQEIQEMLTSPTQKPGVYHSLMLLQLISSGGAFILVPLVYLNRFDNSISLKNRFVNFQVFIFTALVVLAMVPFHTLSVKLSEEVPVGFLPQQVLDWFENRQIALQDLTKFLAGFKSPFQLIEAMLVMAIIPGIGEELFFRGLMQPKFMQVTKNYHIAIWATALIFGLIHFEFTGLLSRTLLGAFFGYVYYFTGNLWLPIIGHILNNAMALAGNFVLTNLMREEQDPQLGLLEWGLGIGSVFVSSILFFFLYRKVKRTQDERLADLENSYQR
jgi:membrane protease YdiL (CAAX protease family)